MSFPKLKLHKDLDLNVCRDCGNILMVKGDALALDQALSDSVTSLTKGYIENLLSKFTWNQRQMADCIGFTPVYLSELKNGKSVPEYRTFNYFKVLSECPGAVQLVLEDDPKFLKPVTPYRSAEPKNAVEILPMAGNDYAMAA